MYVEYYMNNFIWLLKSVYCFGKTSKQTVKNKSGSVVSSTINFTGLSNMHVEEH